MAAIKSQDEVTDITALLKERRIEIGVSQAKLAKHCGFANRSAVSRLEAGQQEWRFKDVLKACELLQVKIELSF